MNTDATRTVDPSTATGDAVNALRDLLTMSATGATGSGAIPGVPEPPPGFAIEREIGVGGMGVVYLARQTGLNRPVALKLVKASEKVDAKALIRFLAEAEAVAAVRHPNVVEVYQYGDHHGQPYMALEYCPGGDLTSLSKSVPVRDAAWFHRIAHLMAKVADGVNAAHAQGIVHRDLKPGNVLLTADGTPKVADFGLAKRGIGSDLTNTLAVMGTPAYMAPEQAGGGTKFVGPEADVWALGVMLYELCCGERPIDTSGPVMDALARVANPVVPRLRVRVPTVPTDIALIARKCLSIDPRDRYPTAGDLAADLRNWLDDMPVFARPAGAFQKGAKWLLRNPAVTANLGVAILLIALGVAVVLWYGTRSRDLEAQARLQEREAAEKATALEQETAKSNAHWVESERRLDLGRLHEAGSDFESNAIRSALEKLATIAPQNRCIAWGLLRERFDGGDLLLWDERMVQTNCVALSPDGRRIVTGSADKTRVWNAITGECLFTLPVSSSVRSAMFSPDGTRIVTGTDDNSVRVWMAVNGQQVFTLPGHNGAVNSVAFSPDGMRIVTGSEDKMARVWDAATGQLVLELKGHTWGVNVAAFSPDGRCVVTGSSDNTARVWDMNTRRCLRELTDLNGSVKSATFSPDGRRIFFGGPAGISLWDVETGQTLFNRQGNKFSVTSAAFTPDGRRIVTSGFGNDGPQVLDTMTGQVLVTLKGHTSPVAGVGVSADGRRIVTAGMWDRTARVWDAATGEKFVELTGHTHKVNCVAFSPDGKQIVTGHGNHTAGVWDAVTCQCLNELKGHTGEVHSVAFSADGGQIVTGSADKTARVWDVPSGKPVLELTGHTAGVTSVAFSPDGQRIVTGSDDKTARVWDGTTGMRVHVLNTYAPVYSVEISPDGQRILVSNNSPTLWDTASGRHVDQFRSRQGSHILSASLSPDGQRILTGSVEDHATVWDVASKQRLFELKGPLEVVKSVSFSRDGRRLVTGSSDGTVRMWDAATGLHLIELNSPGGGIRDVNCSPDSRRMATVSHDGIVRLWETNYSEPTLHLPPSEKKLARSRMIARPRPDLHAKLAEEYKDDPFAAAVQRSLEQKARGQLAMEAGDFQEAFGHFLAAEILRPKLQSSRELLPAPRRAD